MDKKYIKNLEKIARNKRNKRNKRKETRTPKYMLNIHTTTNILKGARQVFKLQMNLFASNFRVLIFLLIFL